jgi:SAM-dependent methyltransferase
MGFRDNFQQVFDLKVKTCEGLLKLAEPFVSTSSCERRHLDVGCAFGYMIHAAEARGYKSKGIDISSAADEAIRLGYDVRKSFLEDGLLPDSHFDLLSAVDVIEHILQPRRWLEESKRVLKKGGVLLLVTPDSSSFSARIRKSRWAHYKIEHLHYYSPPTLKKLLLSVGFDVVKITIGVKYLTLRYITNHYDKFHPKSLETRILRMLRAMSPRDLFSHPLRFPSGMVAIGKKL